MTRLAPPIRRVNHGKGHRYVDSQGQRVPGVTSIIGDGLPRPALINWAANTTAECAVDRWDELAELRPAQRLKALQQARFTARDAAARRGTEVHQLAERLVAGGEVELPEAIAGHVEAYAAWLDAWQVQPVVVEGVCISYRHGYAGTFDLIADLLDVEDPRRTVRWLLDLKTSQSGVFGETALQLAAYRYAEAFRPAGGDAEVEVPEVEQTGVVHVTADGAHLVPVQAGPVQYRQFLYVQQVAEFCESSRDLVGTPLPAPGRDAA